jgi:uncharacterized protein YfdQ (DUF2303 family)
MNQPAQTAAASTSHGPNLHTADAMQMAATLMALAGATQEPVEVAGARFITIPPGYCHKDITAEVERAQAAPQRKRGTVAVKDIASLVVYLADQKAQERSYIYADPDARTITAVFNDHRADAGWRDHRVGFTAEYTPEFKRWLDNNGAARAKAQGDFAEFIEDNLADIAAPFAQQLLDVATTIQATSGIEFKSAKRLQDGQTQLGYVETIDARAGADGGLTIPKEFTLGLRIFKNGGGYLVKARLKYRLASGAVKFWYELDRPERAVEDAFAGYVSEVREKSGYAVLVGVA